MISNVAVTGFKCFATPQTLRMGRLTLLAGLNSSGKSSALQPMLLLAQALRNKRNPRALPLNGALIQLGSAGDVLSRGETRPSISIDVSLDEGRALRWTLQSKAGERWLHRMNQGGAEENADPIEWPLIEESGLLDLVYLGAVRLGASGAFPCYDGDASVTDVGADGRYAAYWYNQYADNEVAEDRRAPGETAGTFRKQVDAWLSTLFETVQVNVQSNPQLSMLGIQFRMSDSGGWEQPANVGYGVSYAFPIVVALLAARAGQIVVIDSPEAHLHPSAQSQMGRLLARFASAGVQIVVETHSDHLLNGARIAVKEQIIQHNDVVIQFVKRGEAGSVIEDIGINERGRIHHWPDGFFDQLETDLAQL